MRFTEEEYAEMMHGRGIITKPRASKYHNIKTEIEGVKFDSKKEAQAYQDFQEQLRYGLIKGVKIHPTYLLQEAFEKVGKKWRAITYEADFEIEENDGTKKIYDVKPITNRGAFTTAVFDLKRKLFEKKYPDLTIIII